MFVLDPTSEFLKSNLYRNVHLKRFKIAHYNVPADRKIGNQQQDRSWAQ
jgi:hypothetical protein